MPPLWDGTTDKASLPAHLDIARPSLSCRQKQESTSMVGVKFVHLGVPPYIIIVEGSFCATLMGWNHS